jgi:hypothetical protein
MNMSSGRYVVIFLTPGGLSLPFNPFPPELLKLPPPEQGRQTPNPKYRLGSSWKQKQLQKRLYMILQLDVDVGRDIGGTGSAV